MSAEAPSLTREDWLAKRSSMVGIGGSEASVIFNLSPFCSAYELYLIKRGEAPNKPETEAQRWGHVLEAPIADEYARRTGRTLRRVADFEVSEAHPFMFASIDRLIIGSDEEGDGVYEGKALSGFTKLTDGLPEYIWIQMQHYLAVRNLAWGEVAMLLGGQKFETRRVTRDDEAILMIVDGEREFMRRIELKDPPKPDGLASTSALLKRMYPTGKSETIFLDEGGAKAEAIRFVQLRDQALLIKGEIDSLKNGFKERMKAAETAVIPGWGKLTWKTVAPKPEPKIDFERLKAEQPETYDRYVTEEARKPYRRFLTCPLKETTGDEDGN